MAATFQFAIQNGAGAGVATDIGNGAGGNYWNYKNADTNDPADYDDNPITAGNCSYEVYIRGHFTDVFNLVENILFWASGLDLTGYGSAAAMTGSVQAVYAQPTTVDNGDAAIPEAVGAALDISQAPDLTAPGYSKYARTQLETDADATPGDGGTTTFSLRYDES